MFPFFLFCVDIFPLLYLLCCITFYRFCTLANQGLYPALLYFTMLYQIQLNRLACIMSPYYFLHSWHAKKWGASTSRTTNWPWQFRSNLTKVISFLSDVELRQQHLDLLQLTPFYHFLLPFINKAVNPKHIKGTKKGLVHILSSYDKEQQVIVIAGKKLSITPT